MTKFKRGDVVDIFPHKRSTMALRAKVLGAIAHTHNGIIYQVKADRLNNLILRVPEINLVLVSVYDGNEPSNFADIRHIWNPKR